MSSKRKKATDAGMWATIRFAVSAGWPETLRLIAVLSLVTGLPVGTAVLGREVAATAVRQFFGS